MYTPANRRSTSRTVLLHSATRPRRRALLPLAQHGFHAAGYSRAGDFDDPIRASCPEYVVPYAARLPGISRCLAWGVLRFLGLAWLIRRGRG
jgi:hypothetical protein